MTLRTRCWTYTKRSAASSGECSRFEHKAPRQITREIDEEKMRRDLVTLQLGIMYAQMSLSKRAGDVKLKVSSLAIPRAEIAQDNLRCSSKELSRCHKQNGSPAAALPSSDWKYPLDILRLGAVPSAPGITVEPVTGRFVRRLSGSN